MSKSRWTALNRRIEACGKCSRLTRHCRKIAREKRKAYLDHEYWGRPVPNFGSASADLLVVGSHGRRGVQHLLLGSVAEKLLRKVVVSVLIVRE